MTQSLAQLVDRLAIVDTPGTPAPHATQGNTGEDIRPQTPTRTYTSSSRIPRPWFPSFQRAPATTTQQPLAHRLPTQAEDIAEYKREYVVLGRDFHHDMPLVEYCGLRGMDHPREPQRGGHQQQQGHNIDFIRKVGKLTIPSFDGSSKCTARVWVQKLDMYYKLNQMIETEASDSCAFEGQLDGHDDSACPSSSPSCNVEDSTLQHSGDTCEDSYVLALRHDEIRRLDDLSMGVDMASRKSCMEDDELPMMSEPHFSSSQSPMLATTHEDISGILDMVEEPCVGIVHKGHMDLWTQEERYGLEIVDLTHTYQYEESESRLLEIPLMDQVVEIDSLLGHLLPGSIFSDEDALLIGRDDHSTCLDTSVWYPGADDISRVSAQEDTTAHTGYDAIHMGVVVGDGVHWHTGGLSSTGDSGQFSALYFEECVVGDSIVDTSSERHEVAPQ
jgi:glycerol-3-phosphate cytidylyltransferase-like family protein